MVTPIVDTGYPIKYMELKDNTHFENFFQNSFMHFYLRTPEMQQLEDDARLMAAKIKCEQIRKEAHFLVGVDKIDPNVFYCFVAYSIFGESLYLYFAYTKKDFRGFGFFRKALDMLKDRTSNYFYALPVRIRHHSILEDFERRTL